MYSKVVRFFNPGFLFLKALKVARQQKGEKRWSGRNEVYLNKTKKQRCCRRRGNFSSVSRKRARWKKGSESEQQMAIKFISKTFHAKPCLFPFVSEVGRNGSETTFRIHSVGHAQVAIANSFNRWNDLEEEESNETRASLYDIYTPRTRISSFSIKIRYFLLRGKIKIQKNSVEKRRQIIACACMQNMWVS